MTLPHFTDPRLVASRPPGTTNAALALALPRPPTSPTPYAFPVVATIAPMLGSVLIWAITHSPFALVFAALAPIVATASLVDARWGGRKHRNREHQRFSADVSRTTEVIASRHAAERAQLNRLFPPISDVVRSPGRVPALWTVKLDGAVLVRIGSGDAQSDLRVDGVPAEIRGTRIVEVLNRLGDTAACLADAPVRVDARFGIAICGPPMLARAMARAQLIRLTGLLHPLSVVIRRPDDPEWRWLDDVPHRVQIADPSAGFPVGGVRSLRVGSEGALSNSSGPSKTDPERCTVIELLGRPTSGATAPNGVPRIVIAVAENHSALPRDCRHRITVVGTPGALLTDGDSVHPGVTLDPEYASQEDAIAWARKLRRWAETEEISLIGEDPPPMIRFSDLESVPVGARTTPTGLRCVIGTTGNAPWEIDLVSDGPHAVVGGTTGSGKSELLITWILALASTYSPRQVTFLLVDFKGGVSFAPVRNLPHTAGVITDLDPMSAARALESLRAELRYRERFLLDVGHKTIDEVPAGSNLPRLVIVVDEFAALANDFPELRALFADIAARGRSLGVHLILCTQRPADALREAILANCTLRISLRVNSAADSIALIGTARAAELPREPVGRALVARSGHPPTIVQIAVSDPSDPSQVAERWPDPAPIRKPWCDPLPGIIQPGSLGRAPSGVAFALRDLPEEQRQDVAEYDPSRHGNLLVHGARGSGKSTALFTVAAGVPKVCWIPTDSGGAWETVAGLMGDLECSGNPSLLVLIDDLDVLVSRFELDHQREFLDRLARLLREGPKRNITFAVSTQQLSAVVNAVGLLCESRLLLRLSDRQEHLMAGGRGDQYDPKLGPGAGFWGGQRVQVIATPAPHAAESALPEAVVFDRGAVTAVVAAAPRDFAARLKRTLGATDLCVQFVEDLQAANSLNRAGHGGPSEQVAVVPGGQHTLVIGNSDDWQSSWSILANLRRRQQLLFDRCSVSEFRVITRLRILPPPLSSEGELWRVDADNRVTRVRLAASG